MYLKTTSPQFHPFGYIQNEKNQYNIEQKIYYNKKPGFFKVIDHEVSFKVKDGIALLLILDEENTQHQFVIHRESVLYAGIPHVVLPVTDSVDLEVSIQTSENFNIQVIHTDDTVEYLPITSQLHVTDIYSYYYSVKGQNYFFEGESHSYWELTYVDTGELITTVDGKRHKLESQNLILYFPQQFHQQIIPKGKASSYLTIMFDLKISNEDIFKLKNKVFECTQEIHDLIKNFVKQANLMEEHDHPYSRNLMIAHLQEILIYLLQSDAEVVEPLQVLSNPVQTSFENETIDEINAFILRNMDKNLSVNDLCEHFSFSRSSLQLLFKKHIGLPPKEYINELKLKEAQRLISTDRYTLTEISHQLGFSSIHYFSRKFKSHFGVSPSDYSKSILKINGNN